MKKAEETETKREKYKEKGVNYKKNLECCLKIYFP